ncbi:FYVE and coiled-coil domain-containing protein 1 isoform X1 [Megalobrama amblycephala]|uniref:FYVE and coiled-coil domain-containing protein 1 isoform X1 n=1 Tax=Megalobrama amblycephala TaxID=75352 RepID=UPI0020147A79|nr:FYVE and coiled-coil domain-containing protein 1 isoform X1 [Megalobrama amblycephala]XP_048018465.1 FYVE and coiled-coil domain-containing protein 1 isoform X1 [Megalobrama amblycephala]
MSTVGENQLQRIIRDLHDAVSELSKEHCDTGEPISDDSSSLHKFCYKLEYLLQFDQKERTTFLGSRKDYWDYFCDCLAKIKGANDGIRFVKSISELKTSLGKGRAFIRYCLVHQRLADTLQQCLMNYKITCEWYYERSPFLKSHLNIDIINHLYELNEVQFDVASRGHDLDSDWPTFARKTLGSALSPAHVWKPPSRCSSINSLVSTYSQQAQEFPPGQEFGSSLLGDLGELGELSCSASEDLRIELDQSELKQKELQEKVQQLTSEAADLRAVLSDLQEQLLAKGPNQEKEGEPSTGEQEVVKAVRECTDRLHTTTQDLGALRTSERNLESKLSIAENRNMELLAKLDGALSEKGQQAASYCDSAWKIQELLNKLKEAEEDRIESKRESEDRARLAERLAQELTLQEEKLKEMEGKLDTCRVSADKERTTAMQQADELQVTISHLQGALSLKEREAGNLQTQLQDVQRALEAQEGQLEEHKKRMQEELQHRSVLEEQLNTKMNELSTSNQKIRQLENRNQRLTAESQSFQTQAKKLEEYKSQCTSLMEINAKLIQTVKRNEESSKELAQIKTALERELITAQASQRKLRSQLESAGLTVENQNLEKCIQNGQMNNEETEIEQLGEKSISSLEELDDSAAVPQENKRMYSTHLLEAIESSTTDNGESTSRLALAEAQLELNMKEVSRLQEEVMELRAQLLVSSEERIKIQALHEVTEASREDLRAQTEQLKSQVEELNRRHVEELLRCHEREDTLVKERDMEAKVRAEIQTSMTAMREELHLLKKQNSTLALENGEAREALHRANTETAELGVHVCMLTGQNEEAKLRWEELSTKLQELQMEAQEEVETLSDSMEAMSKDNARLQEQLKQTEGLPEAMQKLQERLEQAEEEAKSLQEIRQREVDTLRSQLSDEAVHHQSQMQGLNEELDALRKRLDNEMEKVSSLESKVLELESVNSDHSQMIEKKNALIGDSETVIHQKEEQIKNLRVDLSRAEKELTLAQQSCHELSVNLNRSAMEKQDIELKMSAEIDDLFRTKKNLEERLIELIREKDALWQKSDALEFEQKLRSEEQTDRDVTYCLSCRNHFGWMLHRHNCRLCGRPFCYYCCSYAVSVHQGGAKERCCKDCFTQHNAAQERHPKAKLGSPKRSMSSPTRSSTPGIPWELKSPGPDDTAYDIITEEEVNCTHDSDSYYTTALSPETLQLSSSDVTSTEDSDELIGSVQDAEICLLKSGEMTLSVPFSVKDVNQFGDTSRELFIKSSCYSAILITAAHPGPTISWIFSSKPKSIAFSVVYRESTETPLEGAKVLIPLTRCNSHKETIQGQLKVRNAGEYTLIFDNSFSRFVSKKVLYKLSVEEPEEANGSDCSS